MSASPPVSRSVVLVIDDELALLETIRAGLGDEFEIETAISAEEGTMLAGTRRYDAVICDQLLPGEQGLDFLARVAGQFPAMRRIMMTGYLNPELLSRSVSIGQLSACLVKPVPLAELKQALRDALAKK
jgi:two-component system, NtrC family, response regulator HupR/HoxA